MSGPARVTDWTAVAQALAASGCDLSEAVPLQTSCGWCGKRRMVEGPLSPEGKESTGMCEPCAVQFRKEAGLA